jgi:hypothetical protein
MQFSAVDPPEEIMRLIEQYTNRIQPVSYPEGEEAAPPESPMKIHIGEKVEKEKESPEQPEDRKEQE